MHLPLYKTNLLFFLTRMFRDRREYVFISIVCAYIRQIEDSLARGSLELIGNPTKTDMASRRGLWSE